MRRFLVFAIAIFLSFPSWASNAITYTAKSKLPETVSYDFAGLNIYALNDSIISHTFSNGVGVITFNDEVTQIGRHAFWNCDSLISISIPEGVRIIEEWAFEGCSSLTSITFPSSVTNIDSAAIWNCPNLENIYIDPNNTVYDSRNNCNAILNGCSLLLGCKNTIIPNSVTRIERNAFRGCTSLSSIVIPSSVTEICEFAFEGCTNLASVSMQDGVTTIGWGAFEGCSSLTSISLPSSMLSIGDNAFMSCNSLAFVTINEGVKSIGIGAFADCTSLAAITIPNSVTHIGYSAFVGCTSLPIEDNLRYADTYLVEVVDTTFNTYQIKDGTRWVGESAFRGSTSLVSITLPESVFDIGNYAFFGCPSLTSVVLSNGLTSIGDYAFYACTSLSAISIPNSLVYIGNAAFSWNESLTSVTIESPSIAGKTYSTTANLGSIFGSQVTSYTIGDSVTTIGDLAFYKCTGMTSVSIGKSVTSIGNKAFNGCTNLKTVYNKSSLYFWKGSSSYGYIAYYADTVYNGEIVGDFVIQSDTILSGYIGQGGDVIIPDGITEIDAYTFQNDTNIISVTIPSSMTHIGGNAFYGCTNLKTVYNYSSLGIIKGYTNYGYVAYYADHVYNGKVVGDFVIKNDSILIEYIGHGGDVVIPDYVTIIENNVFRDCTTLTSVTIPNSVTTIKSAAFYGCTGLSTITIPTSVTSISNDAFQGCSNLTSVVWKAINCTSTSKQGLFYSSRESISSFVLGDSVQIIPQDLCYNMTELSHVSIPNTVTSIGNYAFCHCTGLTSIEIPSTVNSIGLAAFTDCSGVTAIVVENGNEVYDSRNNCNAIIERATNTLIYGCQNTQIPDSIVIDTDAFRNCIGLTSITIPQSVTSFGRSSFYGCTNLKTVHNHTSLTMVKGSSNYGYVAYYADSVYNGFIEGDFVIQNDTIVTAYLGTSNDMVIPNKITRIGENAFSTRTGLNSVIIGPAVITIGNSAFAGCTKLRHITCYALNPPSANANSFANYNVNLYVPCDNLEDYKFDVVFGSFKYLQCIGAEETSTTTTTVTPSNNDATFTWPTADNAVTYTLTITKNGIVFCTLTFNVYGQLTNIAFAPGRNSARHSEAAELTATGYQFTVTGLESGTSYDYSVIVSDANGNTIANYSGAFSTSGTPTNTESILMNSAAQKFLRNGQVLIRRGDNIYNMQGQVVE